MENEFQKVERARTFGSMWFYDKKNNRYVPHHELIGNEWVDTPEYLELMKRCVLE